MENNYLKEIVCRKEIMQKAINGIKLTLEERKWLLTHPVYNLCSEELAYNTIIEQLEFNICYILKVKIESVCYDKRIVPIVGIPYGKGYICPDFDVIDLRGIAKKSRKIKMVSLECDTRWEYDIEYYSDLGLLLVEYQCDYFDDLVNLHKRESSGTGNPFFSIKRQVINENSVRYFCKSPLNDSFDALVFTIEWTKKQ